MLAGIGVAEKEPVMRNTMAGHLSNSQDAGLHARTVSTESTVDSDMIDEGGNPIWKNRVESWKDKKKKGAVRLLKKFKCLLINTLKKSSSKSADPNGMQPLSQIIPIPKSQIAPYRTVIILRLIILGLFFHYQITNPVESSYGL
ncbi:putative cellulose synthase (UDP-forming) [Helianthus anomalus]